MQIGEVAERTQLSLRTIRHCDQVGLGTPAARSEGGFRLYPEADVERLHRIRRRITPLGFSLEEPAEVLTVIEHGSNHESMSEIVRTRTRRPRQTRVQGA